VSDNGKSYDSNKAWLHAGVFFLAAVGIGLWSGVTQQLLSLPLVAKELLESEPWRWASEIYLLIVVVGYGFIWPRGTLHHGRPLRPVACLLFGLLWGLAQGQIFLSIWTWAGRAELGVWPTAGLAYLGIAVYNGLWHGLYWDIHVSPPHNIAAWNLRKVAFAHTPNLLYTLWYLVEFGTLWMVVVMQCIALMLSCWFMHFPRPGDHGAPAPQSEI
jgi:hypothetical protein